jgi:hypothetical protein
LILLQICYRVVQVIDDCGIEEARSIVIELDELTAALGRKVKIPCTEKAHLWSSQLRNRWRVSAGRRLPRLASGNLVKYPDKFGNLCECAAGDHLMPWHHGKLSWDNWHPGSLKCGKESFSKCSLEIQTITSS